MKQNICILFDLDGTIADTLTDLTNAVNAACASVGIPPLPAARVRALVGNGAENLMKSVAGPDHAESAPEMLLAFRAAYADRLLDNTVPYAGVPALLAELKNRGYPLGVVSNKPDAATKAIVEKLFPGVFGYVAGALPNGPRKPDPAPVQAAMAALQSGAAVYVGDSEPDVAVAKNAALPGIFVTWGFRSREELLKAGAVLLADNPADLLQAVVSAAEAYSSSSAM